MPTPATESDLEELLSRPYPETIEMMRRLDGDFLVLGVGGKMGPTLARMLVRACESAGVEKRVFGVARFSEPGLQDQLESHGVQTIACDLSDLAAVQALPKCKNVFFMAGRKFGSVGSEALTWVMNVLVPGNVAQTFTESRIVAFSTGCVYALADAQSISTESDAPAPVGEYANSCLGRERIFEHYSRENGNPALLFRLNYAIDLRYGVLQDIAADIWNGRPVNRNVQAVNIIWQGDANNRAILSLERAASPPAILNVTGMETVSTEELATQLAAELQRPVTFTGAPTPKAYLSDASRSVEWFGPPRVSLEEMISWTADWIKNGGRQLDKPTHFSVTDGQFLDESKTVENDNAAANARS